VPTCAGVGASYALVGLCGRRSSRRSCGRRSCGQRSCGHPGARVTCARHITPNLCARTLPAAQLACPAAGCAELTGDSAPDEWHSAMLAGWTCSCSGSSHAFMERRPDKILGAHSKTSAGFLADNEVRGVPCHVHGVLRYQDACAAHLSAGSGKGPGPTWRCSLRPRSSQARGLNKVGTWPASPCLRQWTGGRSDVPPFRRGGRSAYVG
jgi:hypothetical protein